PVQGEVHPVHPGIALEEEPVEGRVVLVRLTAEEGLCLQAVLPGDQPGQRGELVLALQAHEEGARLRVLIGEAEAFQGSLDGIAGGGVVGCHGTTLLLVRLPRPQHRYTPWQACRLSQTSRKRTRACAPPR